MALCAAWCVCLASAEPDAWCVRESQRCEALIETAAPAERIALFLQMAELDCMRGDFEQADTWLTRALDMATAQTRDIKGDAVRPVRDLSMVQYTKGRVLRSQSRFAEAEQAFKHARDGAKLVLGATDPLVVRAAGAHASVMAARGDLEQARQLCTWAVVHVTEHCGSNDVEVAWIDEMMGRIYATAGRYNLALPVYEHMLTVRKSALSPPHPDLATAHNRLASVLFELKRTDEAIPHLEQARDIRARAFGPDHPLTQRSRENLSKAQSSVGESP